jgi:uncharacterized protein YfkK (UPF0435 family)
MGKGLKGSFRAKTGHVDAEAFLTITETTLNFSQKIAVVKIEVFRNEESYNLKELSTGDLTVRIQPEAQEVRETMEGDVLFTLPAFDEVLGTDQLSNEKYNPVLALYALIKKIPQFSNWEGE